MPVPVLDVSPDDDEPVQLAELVELVEPPDPLEEVELTEAVMSGMDAGPAPKLDTAGAAGLHADRHRARGIGVRRTALLYLRAASPSGFLLTAHPGGEQRSSSAPEAGLLFQPQSLLNGLVLTVIHAADEHCRSAVDRLLPAWLPVYTDLAATHAAAKVSQGPTCG